MKVCFITSECVPYVKTGGLADVSGSLPEALNKNNAEVKIFLPLYDTIDRIKHEINPAEGLSDSVSIGGINHSYNVFHTRHANVLDVFFIDCPEYFNRGVVYTGDEDENERYILFQHAVLKSLQKMKWAPDVFHCNDWQSALIPPLLKLQYSWDALFQKSKTLLSIHNIGYQGIFPEDSVVKAGFESSLFVLGGPFEFNRFANFLKAGIYYSDVISTVSPTYAKEIQTPEFGSGLDGVLRSRGGNVYGILNGIDTNDWNPEKDKLIKRNYSFITLKNKYENKKHLLEISGLETDINIPLFGIVSRLAWQKGFELILELIEKRIDEKFKLVVLGAGEKKYEDAFLELMNEYPDKVKIYIEYNNSIAHLITAGSDFFFMPSRYEPCGLNQMYSLNYGTLPIVRNVGGLADTVIDVDNKNGNGFSFNEFELEGIESSFDKALMLYKNNNKMKTVIKRGMSSDFSWDKSAKEYLDLYSKLSI
ncbi:MAG: glycogen/starch synthase [Candidatus Kapaibacterium sp.]